MYIDKNTFNTIFLFLIVYLRIQNLTYLRKYRSVHLFRFIYPDDIWI